MIRNSFIFLDKISSKTEQNLWQQGITDWNDFLKIKEINGISPKRKAYYNRKLQEAKQELQKDNSAYFAQILPKKETWRLYQYFKEEACFLDLEVDSYGKIILLGIADEYQTKIFVKGFNLEKELIKKELNRYKLIITFNGSAFDLPKLKKQLQLEIKIPHLDLKPLCINLDLKGGLKEVEKKLNLNRPQHLRGSPVDLWKAFHASGDQEWLDLLIAYNQEDVENLKRIADYCYLQLSITKIREMDFRDAGDGTVSHNLKKYSGAVSPYLYP
ncbi:MAG: ribonuclease H-like domain-containing protein [Candidatus Woesearchaeota archaeon]